MRRYGFRVKTTLENEDVWYPANEVAGRWLLWVGIAAVVSALVTYLLPIPSGGVYASIVGAVVLAGPAVTLLKCFLYLRTLSPKE